MSDPFSETATEDLPREPLVGLRRRHQAGFIFRHNHEEDEEIDNPVRRGAEVNIENRNRIDAQNMGWNAPPQQNTGVYDNDEEETIRDDADTNNRRATAAGQESTTPNRFSPLSGSIGIGMFRISRLYCFFSILLATMAIVLSPIPIHKMQFHDVATILIDVREGDNVKSRKVEKIGGRRDVKKKTNDRDSIVSELKLWSVEEFIDENDLLEISLGILHLNDRPRTKLFIRRDQFDRFVSALLYVPRDRYNSKVREQAGELIRDSFGGRLSAYYPQFGDSPLARVHYIIGLNPFDHPEPDVDELERRVALLARTWEDDFETHVRRTATDKVRLRMPAYEGAFKAGYRELYDPEEALKDVIKIESLTDPQQVAVRVYT